MKDLLSFLNFDTKTQDGITKITVWLAILVYFLFLNFFVIPINVPNQPSDYTLYLFVLFVPAAIKLIFFSGDPISHKTDGEARFFQAQFPDSYIAQKFKIDKPLAQHLWFKALDKRKDDGEIKRTYQYGYTCRLVYYIRRLMAGFTALSVFLIVTNVSLRYYRAYHHWAGCAGIWSSLAAVYNLKGKLLYLAHVVAIWLFLHFANKIGENPTGVWARWKHINDRNKAWTDRFATLEEFRAFADPTPTPPSDAKASS